MHAGLKRDEKGMIKKKLTRNSTGENQLPPAIAQFLMPAPRTSRNQLEVRVCSKLLRG